MSQSRSLGTLPVMSTKYDRIAEQPGGQLLIGEKGWEYTDLGFIVDRKKRTAWQVPIGSALGRGYWTTTKKGTWRLPRSYRVTMWGEKPLGFEDKTAQEPARPRPTADELVTMAVYITNGRKMRDAKELDMSVPEFRAAWRDLAEQIDRILTQDYEVQFPD